MFKHDALLGQIALEQRFITERQLLACTNPANLPRKAGEPASPSGPPGLGEILLKKGLVGAEDLLQLLQEQCGLLEAKDPHAKARQKEVALGRRLIKEALASAEQVAEALLLQVQLLEEGKPLSTITELLSTLGHLRPAPNQRAQEMRNENLLRCRQCGARYSVPANRAAPLPRCRKCGGPIGPEEGSPTGDTNPIALVPDASAQDPRRISDQDISEALVATKLASVEDVERARGMKTDLVKAGVNSTLEIVFTDANSVKPEQWQALYAKKGWKVLRCPRCNALYDIAASGPPREFRCESCGALLRPPSPSPAKPAPAAEAPRKPAPAAPPRRPAPSPAPRRPAVEPEEAGEDGEAQATLLDLEEALDRAASAKDPEERRFRAETCKDRLSKLAKWAQAERPGSRLLGQVYALLGRYHGVLGDRRLSDQALLAAVDLGETLDPEEIFRIGRYFSADRRSDGPALKLYVAFLKELPFRGDKLSEDDRHRIHAFLLAQASAVDGELPELREALARAYAQAFPRQPLVQYASALWRIRKSDWNGALPALQSVWDTLELANPSLRKRRNEVGRQLARVCAEVGDRDQALDVLLECIDCDPLQVDSYVEAAELSLSLDAKPGLKDTINSARRRARLGKALRWLDRAAENLKRTGASADAVAERIMAARIRLQTVLDSIV